MATSRHADSGKAAEKQAEAWLMQRSAGLHEFAYHRYPDARAARGALAAQPADYLVAAGRAGVFHLEVKETGEERRLPKAKVSQYGKLLMFWWAGIQPLVLVYRSRFNDWTYFTARELFPPSSDRQTIDTPTSFPFAGRPTFVSATLALDEMFSCPR